MSLNTKGVKFVLIFVYNRFEISGVQWKLLQNKNFTKELFFFLHSDVGNWFICKYEKSQFIDKKSNLNFQRCKGIEN